MLSRYFGAAALALQCAHAFRDASPFFFLSSSELDTQFRDAHIASASTIEANVNPFLFDCVNHAYVFVSQAGVSSLDYSTEQPHLMKRLNGKDKHIKTAVKVSNAVGMVDAESLGLAVQSRCSQAAEDFTHLPLSDKHVQDGWIPHIEQHTQTISVQFPAPPSDKDERSSALARADSYLNDILKQLDTYTVIYYTTPVSAEQYQEIQHPDEVYEMDSPFPSGMHGDLKRDVGGYASSNNTNTGNLYSDVPLFEKYQFVNQGIFIGVAVSLLLLFILSIGIRAIAGLEVSYMAFSKEMGPAAQKKQQQ